MELLEITNEIEADMIEIEGFTLILFYHNDEEITFFNSNN